MLPGVLILANYYQVLILKVHFISYLTTRRLWFVVCFSSVGGFDTIVFQNLNNIYVQSNKDSPTLESLHRWFTCIAMTLLCPYHHSVLK